MDNQNKSTNESNTNIKPKSNTTKQTTRKKSKMLIVVLTIVIMLIIIASVGCYFIWQNIEKNKSVGTTWGDTYYAYLKEASTEKDLSEREKYGIQQNMENTQIQFCDIEGFDSPAMIMTYTKNDTNYVNTYKISNNNKVVNVSYKEPSTVEFLYNIELQQYIWYVHIQTGNTDSYKPISSGFKDSNSEDISTDNVTNNTNSTNTVNNSNVTNNINITSNNITKVEITPEYTFEKDEATTVETIDGETLSLSKFDETFVRPETDVSQKIDFDINTMDETVIKDTIISTVEGYKPEEQIVTDEVKTSVEQKVTEIETKQEEIKSAQEEKAKKEEEERKAAEEASKGLKVGNHTLKYGTYVSDVSKMPNEDGPMSATIVLNQDGTFSLKAVNLSESDFIGKKSQDCTGTYKIKLHQETYPDEYEDVIEFTPNNGEAPFSFFVNYDNSFSDQWHGYSYSGS